MVRNSHTTAAQNSRFCVSRDEGYLISRTDQLLAVRNSHTTAAQNSRLCVNRDEGYLISRTDQLSVVRNSQNHSGTEQQVLCEQRRKFANRPVIGGAQLSHHSGTEQQALCEQRRRVPLFTLSVVRNSHTTAAQNSRLCVSRDEGCLISRTDQLSVVRHSHTTEAQIRRLCVSRDEGYLISLTGQTSVVRNSRTTELISRSRGSEYPTSARVEKTSIA